MNHTDEVAIRAKECFEEYIAMMIGRGCLVAEDLKTVEISKRLRQMRWLVQQCRESCDKYAAISSAINPTAISGLSDPAYQQLAAEMVEAVDRIQLFMECFYWIAHRTSSTIKRMPGLGNFSCAQTRDVRNNLLEHIEGKQGASNRGFGWGGAEKGPTIASEPYGRDEGLYINAQAFFVEVVRVTQRCTDDPYLVDE